MSAKHKATRTATPRERLHVCPECRSDLVQPVEWWEQGGGRWELERRCPECEWHGNGSFSQRMIDGYDRELDRGSQGLIDDLRRLTRANMEEAIDRFVGALDDDLILPEDF